MKLEHVIDLLNEIEERFPVERWVMDGIPFWPLLRIRLRFQLDDHVPQPSESGISLAGLARSLGKVGKIVSLFARHIFARLADSRHTRSAIRPVDVVFLNHTTCRVLTVKEKWYDIFCEPIAALLRGFNCSSLMLEFAPGGEYRIPRNCESIFIQAALYRLRLRSMLHRRPLAIIDEQESFTEFVTFFSQRFPSLQPPSLEALQREIGYLRLVSEYFKGTLLKTGAALGIVVAYYSSEGMAFNLACKEIGIPSVDIQHGVQGGLHPAYGRWRNVPEQGYSLLPDFFWCWSRNEVEAIQEWSAEMFPRHQAFVGGNLALNMFKQEDNDFVRYFDPLVAVLKARHGEVLHVLVTLVTLQDGVVFSELVKEAIAASSADLFWWVRLHPAMVAERETIRAILKETGNSSVNLDDASDLPLYALLRHVDVHLTEWSSTVIEAESFGVPSVICHEAGTGLYSRYIVNGSAIMAYTCRDLLAAVNTMAARKKQLRRHMEPVFTAADLESFMAENCHWRASGGNRARF